MSTFISIACVLERYSYHSFDYDYDFGDSTPLKIKI
tara:strand:+ start:331 stop:438 length:108 start_codon:yes stop_codon:yes gene_type:complete